MSDEEKKPEIENYIEQIVNKEPNLEKDSRSINYSKQSMPIGIIIGIVAIVAVAAFFAGLYFSNIDSDKVTKSDLDEAILRLESKFENLPQIAPQPSQASPQPSQPVKISVDSDPMKGDPNAPITIIEFSDYECPFCGRFFTQTLPLIEENYINTGKVNFVYRDFPIQSIHPNALPAAVAAECANEQGKFWEYHDIIFQKQNVWNKLDSNSAISEFSQYATDIDLEQQQFDSCLTSGKYLEEVQGDLQDGRSYDITGTPAFFIGNDNLGFVKISGAQPYESFQRVIDEMIRQ